MKYHKNRGYEFEILLQIYISLNEKKADYYNCYRISSGENNYKSKRNEPLRNLTGARAKLALEILGSQALNLFIFGDRYSC